jgi:hypothetical protein
VGRGGFPSERGLACGLTLCSGLVRLQEEEKNKIQNDLRILTERLSRINESLARKVRARALRGSVASCCARGGCSQRASALTDACLVLCRCPSPYHH